MAAGSTWPRWPSCSIEYIQSGGRHAWLPDRHGRLHLRDREAPTIGDDFLLRLHHPGRQIGSQQIFFLLFRAIRIETVMRTGEAEPTLSNGYT
jgi:hypothetical protein